MSQYDKELINSRIIEVCGHYLPGEGRREGQRRRIWPCPICGNDSFSASDQRGYAGCFSTCEMPKAKDAVAIIAYFEDLELSGQQFVRCLQKGYEILAIPEPEDDGGSRNGRLTSGREGDDAHTSGGGDKSPASGQPEEQTNAAAEEEDRQSPPTRKSTHGNLSTSWASSSSLGLLQSLQNGSAEPESASHEEHSGAEQDAEQYRELVDQVYRAFLELCPLMDRDRAFWSSRGVTEETMRKFGFGSLSRGRCHEVLPELERRFGCEALVTVPGFYTSQQGNLHTNLYDDYTLIPYHDRDGYITMVQGRVPGQPEEGKPKYKAPVNSGLHLYVPPGYKPEQVMAVCEGAVGAIVAAQSGIPVAAITGYQCYRIAGARGEADRPLPEHERTDFGGRKVLYLPDEDVKPKTKEAVQAEAPKAARALIEAHGGTPYIAQLPEGYADLDEWLLALDPDERIPKFAELMEGALTPEQWSGEEPQTDDSNEDENHDDRQTDGQTAEQPSDQTGKDEGNHEEVHKTQERTEEDEGHNDSENDGESEDDDEQDDGSEETEKQPQPIGLKRPDPGPRPYRPIPKTNIGEFMYSLIYGLAAGLGFLIVVVFAASEWGPPGLMGLAFLALIIFVSVVITTVVMIYLRRKLYWRRYYAIKNHLAGIK